MSGITGCVDWNRDQRPRRGLVEAMTATLARRGPRGEGTWVSGECLLGHRRAAVSAADDEPQPFLLGRPDEPAAVVVLDGELINRPELAALLRARGRSVAGDSDVALVAAAYGEWGDDVAVRLDGAFALAVWDTRRGTLLLARDALGVQPLFYASHSDGLVFGSEPKAILAHGAVPARVGAQGLVDLFTVAMRRPGDAIFEGMNEVAPGWSVRVDRSGLHHRQYWSPPEGRHDDEPATAVARVRELVEQAVDRRSEAHRPAGVLLSGGLDSSVLAALAAGASARAGTAVPASFAVDFAGGEEDFTADGLHVARDAPFVAAMVSHLGLDHRDTVLDTPTLDDMTAALIARDAPGVGDLDVTLYLLFREVGRQTGVVLSGEGADDIFGGYPWFVAEAQAPTGAFPWSAGVGSRNGMLSADLRARLDLDAAITERYQEALHEVPPPPEGLDATERRMHEVFHLQLTRFLPFLLERKDRMSAAAGLITRVPFCDRALVEYLVTTPWSLQRTGGQEKGLLRAAAADLLPAVVAQRPKSGFPFLQSESYREHVRDGVRGILTDPDSPVRPLLDEAALKDLVEGAGWQKGTFAPPPWLPRALMTDAWLRRYGVTVTV